MNPIQSSPFGAADILLPTGGYEAWSVVACDQFTSQPEYWETLDRQIGSSPSTLRIILPEVYLSHDNSSRIEDINRTMKKYLDNGIFREYPDAMIYVERTLPDGAVRRGIVGAVDLEAYDYTPGSKAMIRATEGTVLERIPPRVKIRENAPLELPHVMLLIDDPHRTVIEPLNTSVMQLLYDFDLSMSGGHLKGCLMTKQQQETLSHALLSLSDVNNGFLFAVGDGNHSLATAKECYRRNPLPQNRFALAEIVNIHDNALVFEPIYRVMFGVDPADLLHTLKSRFSSGNTELEYVAEGIHEYLHVDGFPVGPLQQALDDYLKTHPGSSVDYIHGETVTRQLASKPGAAGFLFDSMKKSDLFPIVERDGVLPRKSFSMGEAQSKRYYMECRRING